jgi:hypothetical protein
MGKDLKYFPTRHGFNHYFGVPHGVGACPCTTCFAPSATAGLVLVITSCHHQFARAFAYSAMLTCVCYCAHSAMLCYALFLLALSSPQDGRCQAPSGHAKNGTAGCQANWAPCPGNRESKKGTVTHKKRVVNNPIPPSTPSPHSLSFPTPHNLYVH